MVERELSSSELLLADFVRTGSEEPFRELVTRHIGLVHSTARRLAGGDAHLAEDISQLVFSDLAKKAGRLPKGTVVAGWLYQHTWFTSSKLVRSEQRRAQRESEAFSMQNDRPSEASEEAQLTALRAELDSALNSLTSPDRDSLVLRFLGEHDLREVGHALGISEDAAQKRVSRALERLRNLLTARQINYSTAALGAALGSFSTDSASLGALAQKISFTAAGIGAAGAGLAAAKVATTFKAQAVLAALLAATIASSVWQARTISQDREIAKGLRAQLAQQDDLRRENDRLRAHTFSDADLATIKANLAELQRLRGEITLLRRTPAVPTAPVVEKIEEEAPAERLQVVIETRVAELKHDLLPQLQQRGFPAVSDVNEFTLNLAGESVKTALNLLRDTAGVHLISAPRVLTADGREASISVTDDQVINGENVSAGVSLGVLPHILADKSSTELALHPSFSVPVEGTAPGAPPLRTWSEDLGVTLRQGHLLLLGRTLRLSGDANNVESKLLIFCISSSIVDAAGNLREPAPE